MIRGSSVASLFSGCFLEMGPVMVMGICDNRVFVTYQALGIPLFFFKKKIFVYFIFWLHWVFIAIHGLSLVAVSRGYSLVAVRGLLIVVDSHAMEHRL